MRKIGILMLMGLSLLGFAQEDVQEDQTPPPAFYNSEVAYKDNVETMSDPGAGGAIDGDDPIPIDEHLPVLVITALVITAYFVRKKQLSVKMKNK